MAQENKYFRTVDSRVDFPAMEKELLAKWYSQGIVEKYINKNQSSDKYFSFLDGPITANNPMGVHHAWGRTYKDLWQRFKNHQGYKQRFQNGFDCQGLWVEVEVEKELGLKNKKDIENLVSGDKKASIARFVQLCKERVEKYASIQTEQSKRLGYFMDWDHSYYTLSSDNNYMIWHFLKKCHERGLIYKGRDSVPWCPRCGTAISQHEMLTEDYREVTHESVFIQFPVEGKENAYLLVWTTTPWTIPANVAVAADKDQDYVLASADNRKYYLLKEVAQKLGLTIEKELKGVDLEGLTYRGPFDHLPRVKEAFGKYQHRVVLTDPMVLPISSDEGTGLVHIAPGAGTEDFQLGKKLNLPVVEVIDEQANYLEGMEEFSSLNAKNDPALIIDYLKEKNNGEFLFKTENITHRYPACWRCKSELVWRVVDEWYIAIDPVREEMKKVTSNISWIPKFGLKRELDWLSNMHDWLISKKRYWGLALPIWQCTECEHFEVIGSEDELKEKAVEGWEKFEGNTPHKPYIDEVKIKCEKCGGMMERIPDVGNPWLDAGIVAYSTIKEDNRGEPLYLKDKNQWEKWFPADFITESFPGQFKNWFYSLIAMSTVLENREPFKTVLGFATLLGEDGRPMHKSWGNSIEFNEGADKIGVDVMRWMYVRQNPADNMLFGYKTADETRRRFHLKLWNTYNYFVTYANLDGWQPSKDAINIKDLTTLDKWILSRLSTTIKKVTTGLNKYHPTSASLAIEELVDDLSLWYVRRSRERVGPAATSKEDKELFYQVMHQVLLTLTQIMSPFIPFISDEIYVNLSKEESVHLTDWPESTYEIDENLENQMREIRQVVERVHGARKESQIPVRQPLARAEVVSAQILKFDQGVLNLAKEELNIKEIEFSTGEEKVILDTTMTPELEEEAKSRELIRKIQEERKNQGLTLEDRVAVFNPWLPGQKENLERISKKTLAASLEKGDFRVEKVS